MMKITGISSKQRKLIIYEDTKYYDGKEYHQTTKEQLHEWIFSKSYTSKYIPIKKHEEKTFEQTFKDFVKTANALRKASLGLGEENESLVNFYKTGNSIQTAKTIFFNYCNKEKIKPEPITDQEYEFINNSTTGALMFGNNGYTGPVYEYDINSFYPNIMKSNQFKIPIKQGEIKTLSKIEFEKMKNTFFCYGIYKCKISSEQPNKLFRFNKNNFYTTQSLRHAKLLGLNIELIDEKDNFLYYSKDTLIQGNKLFGYFVETLYKLKKENPNLKEFKEILNCLWGLLSKQKKTSIVIDMNEPSDIDLDTDKINILSQVLEGDKITITYQYKNNNFVYDFGRMKPFLLSQGRLKLCELLVNHIENIEQVNTDGFKSSKKLDIECGDGIGELRYEGERQNVKIINLNKVIDV